MPHLSFQYSANVEQWVDLHQFCRVLRDAAVATNVFPLAGIRVRGVRCNHCEIADGSMEMGFIDISVRLRGGRELEVRKQATQSIFEAAESFLAPVLDRRPLALSLEMGDIDPNLSPKVSSIRRFLGEAGNHDP